MSIWKKAFATTLLTALPIAGYACTGTWSGGGAVGVWNDVNNWGGVCIPGAPGAAQDTATFGSVVGSSSTVSLVTSSISPILETLTFNNSSTSFTIVGNVSNGLNMEPTPAAPVTINTTGNHTISAQIL
ncbi:MAG TPA: hypothetical protein VIJ14_05035, partial [Rhabdochlamydiaceae bacterium]